MSLMALIVDDDATNRLILEKLLERDGYRVISAREGAEAVTLFEREKPDFVLMDVMMPVMDGYEATRRIKANCGEIFIPVIFLTAITDEIELARCVAAGGDDFLTKPYNHTILRSKINALTRIGALHRTVTDQRAVLQKYHDENVQQNEMAARIMDSILRRGANDHPSVRTHMRATIDFTGDIVLCAFRAPGELHVLVGDFTGHGLSAAVGAIPVSEVFYSMTSNGSSIGEIAESINAKLKLTLPTGMFLAASLFAVDAIQKTVTLWHGGMPDLLVVDRENRIRQRAKALHLPLGVLGVTRFDREVQIFGVEEGDRVFVCSDGVIDAPIATGGRFSFEGYEECFAAPVPPERQFDFVIDSIREITGDGPADDLTLVAITVNAELAAGARMDHVSDVHRAATPWSMHFEFGIATLREFDPVPFVLRGLTEVQGLSRQKELLYTILSELLVNAIDHGVLGLNSATKSTPDGFMSYYTEREARLKKTEQGFVRITLQHQPHAAGGRLTIRLEDSGPGFDFRAQAARLESNQSFSGRGLPLLRQLCASLEYQGNGNVVEAVFDW